MTARMTAGAQPTPWARWLVGAEVVVAAVILAIGVIAAASLDAGHATFHVVLSLVALAPAGALAIRRPHGGRATTAPLLGFAVLAGTQLVEGAGAFGFGPDGYGRVNGIVALHDLGLIIAPIGLIAGALGLTIGFARVVMTRTKRPLLAGIVSLGILAPLLYLIAKLIGL